jgi:cysteinyl-tRNA synthetase
VLADTRQDLNTDTARGLVDLVIDLRKIAREKKDYATSDLIRAKLTELGISLMDTPAGTTWEKS